MIFQPTPLAGAYVLRRAALEDERGFFARTFCVEEFARHGLEATISQCSVSYNRVRATLRGLHYQAAPHEETKTVYCVRGAIWDVIVDLREGSPTRWKWFAAELRASAGDGLHVPKGFAHGFITLEDESIVQYMIGSTYVPECARGIRWNDARLGISWPLQPSVISSRDAALPLLEVP